MNPSKRAEYDRYISDLKRILPPVNGQVMPTYEEWLAEQPDCEFEEVKHYA